MITGLILIKWLDAFLGGKFIYIMYPRVPYVPESLYDQNIFDRVYEKPYGFLKTRSRKCELYTS